MNNNKDDEYYLNDMIHNIEIVMSLGANLTMGKLINDSQLFNNFLMYFINIGNDAHSLTTNLKNGYLQVDWAQIYGLRNIIAHDYSGIDPEIIYDIVKNDIPELYDVAKLMLEDLTIL